MRTMVVCAAVLLIVPLSRGQERHEAAAGIPAAVQEEHARLHTELNDATRAGGKTGDAALALQRLMDPHFAAEEEYALPPLGALNALATGKPVARAQELARLSVRLKADLPKMLDEHKAIGAAVDRLLTAAKAENKAAVAEFAVNLRHHARMEEDVMYPAAIVAGELINRR